MGSRFAGIAPAPVLRSQPQFAAGIDWSNPITSKLLAAFNGATGTTSTDYVKGQWVGVSNTSGFGQAGRGFAGTGNPTHGAIFNSSISNPSTTDNLGVTYSAGSLVLVVCSKSSASTQVFYNSSSAISSSWIGISGGNWVGYNGGSYGSAPVIVGKDQVVIYTFDTTNTTRLYVDGLYIGSYTGTGGFGISGVTLMEFGPNGNYSANATLYQAAIFGKTLSQSDVNSLTANPWQIFKAPAPRKIFNSAYQASRRVSLAPVTRTSQPQFAAQVDWSNPLARGAKALLTGNCPLNIADATMLTGPSKPAATASPVGIASAYRNDTYQETSVFPAIGTASFVEFWCGYAYGDGYVGVSHNDDLCALTGASANNISIYRRKQGDGAVGQWGAVQTWSTVLHSSGEALPITGFQVLVVVRNQTGMYLWRNGDLKASFVEAPSSIAATSFINGSFIENTAYWASASDTVLSGRILSDWTPQQVKSFSANPWQIFK